MSRLTQIIKNAFIRLEGLLYQLLGFFRQILGSLSRLFATFARLLGFSKSEYFLESNEVTGIKSTTTKPVVEDQSTKAPASAPTTNRRRPDANMDYYRKLAQQQNSQR